MSSTSIKKGIATPKRTAAIARPVSRSWLERMEAAFEAKQGLVPVNSGKKRRYAEYYRKAYALGRRRSARAGERWEGRYTAPHGKKAREAEMKRRADGELAE